MSAGLLFTGYVEALPISILDCEGVTRASKSIDAATRAEVNIDVVGSDGGVVDGVDVTLTNTSTGESITTTVKDGVASFQDISGGTWVMGSNTPNLFYSTIILQSEVTALAATGAAVGAGAAGGGVAAAGVVEVSDALSDNTSSIEPTPVPTPEPTVPPPVPTPQPTPECPECNPDEEAPVIDDFFNQQQQTKQSITSQHHVSGQRERAVSVTDKPTAKKLNREDCFIGDEVTPLSPFS